MSLTTGLLAYWKLDEASGNRADSFGSFTLTDNNTVGSATGRIGLASDHIRANNEFLSNTTVCNSIGNAWSFAGWFNFPEIGVANQTIISIRPGAGAANLIQIETNINSGQLRSIIFNSAGSNRKDYQKNGGLVANTWEFFAMTWDGTTFEMYHDGSNAGITKAVDLSLSMTATSRTLRIGAELSASNVADGLIDEIGVWTRALTSAEITELYNGGAGLTYPFTTRSASFLQLL